MFEIHYYKVLGFCLILQCFHFETAKSSKVCENWQFQCNNGDCISAKAKCDTKIDCWDKSDETFEQCYQTKCTYHNCAYGACFTAAQLCDGKRDCWDGTDEYIFQCASDEDSHELQKNKIQGNCHDKLWTPFQCQQSKECIPYSTVCDGVENCRDKSDESTELCVGTACPIGSFRCAYGACIAESAACNNVVDCRDRSDEFPPMCKSLYNITTKIPYAPMQPEPVPGIVSAPANSVDPSSPRNEKNCIVPTDDKAVRLKTVYNGLPFLEGNHYVSHLSTFRLECSPKHVLVGNDVNTCDNGKWKAPWPECVKVCTQSSITNDLSINAVCSYHGQIIDCSKDSLKVGTIAEITCAQGYKSALAATRGIRICNADGSWKRNDPTTKRYECKPDCGKTFNTVEGYPWVVSIYHDISISDYHFRCLGTIVDPFFVLTSVSCFLPTDDIHNALVVLGNHSIPFNPSREHGYDTREINNKEVFKQFALLKMVNPFVLSAKVRPICLSNRNSIPGTDPVEPGRSLGEPFTGLDPKLNALVLTHVLDNNKMWNRFNESQSIISEIKLHYINM